MHKEANTLAQGILYEPLFKNGGFSDEYIK